MKTFNQFLKESLDNPYNFKRVSPAKNKTKHKYSFSDDDGNETHVHITHDKDFPRAQVDFTDSAGSHEKTNKAGTSSVRHFATVKKIMDQHAEQHPDLRFYHFHGDKGEGKGRNRLYNRLTKMAGGTSHDGPRETTHTIPINQEKLRTK